MISAGEPPEPAAARLTAEPLLWRCKDSASATEYFFRGIIYPAKRPVPTGSIRYVRRDKLGGGDQDERRLG